MLRFARNGSAFFFSFLSSVRILVRVAACISCIFKPMFGMRKQQIPPINAHTHSASRRNFSFAPFLLTLRLGIENAGIRICGCVDLNINNSALILNIRLQIARRGAAKPPKERNVRLLSHRFNYIRSTCLTNRSSHSPYIQRG